MDRAVCCVKYGVTTDYVLGMTVVIVDGHAIKFGGPSQNHIAGLPLTKLFVDHHRLHLPVP
ncbi:hypothetical protein [Brevibacterium aurantiacum]|uniref:hypothetical protein n=1 Tax=Brevibacterium aurantiacum TaxID=273384 RepID=UPI00356B74FE